jgi:hypothetical protein
MKKSMKKYDSFLNNKKDIYKDLPFIQKIAPIRIVLESSPKSFTSYIPKVNSQLINSKKNQFIQRSSINTKLYKINDYLSMTNSFFARNNFISQSRNKNQTVDNKTYKNKNNNTSDAKADTGKTFFYFHRNQSTSNYNASTLNDQNNKLLNLNLYNNLQFLEGGKQYVNDKNQKKANFSKSSNSIVYDSSTNDVGTINNYNDNININNDYIINKINNYNLNLLKKSRYFSKTKYIKGKKKFIKDNPKLMNKSLSTKNISLENTRSASIHKTYNDIRIEKLLNKCKKTLMNIIKKIIIKKIKNLKKSEQERIK